MVQTEDQDTKMTIGMMGLAPQTQKGPLEMMGLAPQTARAGIGTPVNGAVDQE